MDKTECIKEDLADQLEDKDLNLFKQAEQPKEQPKSISQFIVSWKGVLTIILIFVIILFILSYSTGYYNI